MVILAPLLLGYFLGSIPFGLVLTRLAGLEDIRTIGSGNIGTTNVLRTGRKGLALATLLLDSGKGAIAVILIGALLQWTTLPMAIAGAAAFLGHCFPIWLGFKGGKGVATFLGTLFALNWPTAIIACLTWLCTALIFKYSSLAALMAALIAPITLVGLGQPIFAFATLFMSLLIFWRHKANIARLIDGEEPRIGNK